MRPEKKKASRLVLLFLAGPVGLFAQSPQATPAATARPAKLRNHFDSDAVLGVPGFFDFLVLAASGEADWRVTAGTNPPSPPNVVVQTVAERPLDSIAVAVRRNVAFRDGTLSLALQRGAGHGGIVFRLAGEKDFVALLIDLTAGDARLTAYRQGRPVQLAQGKAVLGNEWGILTIVANGRDITAAWDGKPLLVASDPHPAAGRCGMATAGPGIVSFDEFVLEPGDKTR